MSEKSKTIFIVGAGVTGLTLAAELSKVYKDKVVIVEKEDFLGGLASTLSNKDLFFDLGSHRIHSDFSPRVIKYIDKIGAQLIRRPRRGALYFDGNFLRYPPNIFNFLKSIPQKKSIRFAISYLHSLIRINSKKTNYEDVMQVAVGKEIYEAFYRSFSKKLWGIDPKEMSPHGAKRRIKFLNPHSIWRIVSGKADYFFYPRRGIGEITKKLEEIILRNNGRIERSTELKKIFLNNGRVERATIAEANGGISNIDISMLISTIPLDSLFEICFGNNQKPPPLVWRQLRVMYIHIREKIKWGNETFYFPSLSVKIGRVSDISKYSPCLNPSMEGTLLTIEIPLSSSDKEWHMVDEDLLRLCIDDLIRVKILDSYPTVLRYFSIKLRDAYPVYKLGWEENFFRIHNELNRVNNLFTVGRKGLFLHCNIDHCMLQGLELSDFILNGNGNSKAAWNKKLPHFLQFYARD